MNPNNNSWEMKNHNISGKKKPKQYDAFYTIKKNYKNLNGSYYQNYGHSFKSISQLPAVIFHF